MAEPKQTPTPAADAAPTEGQTPGAPSPVFVSMPEHLVTALLERLSAVSSSQMSPELTLALEQARAAAAATHALGEQVRRTQRISNADHSHQSAFTFSPTCPLCLKREIHPETGNLGHPKPALRHDTFFCSARVREDELTPMEIELYNQFDKSTECRDGDWKATIDRASGGRRRLNITIEGATSMDTRSSLPALELILSELLFGRDVVDPMVLSARVAELEAAIARLTAAPAPAATK